MDFQEELARHVSERSGTRSHLAIQAEEFCRRNLASLSDLELALPQAASALGSRGVPISSFQVTQKISRSFWRGSREKSYSTPVGWELPGLNKDSFDRTVLSTEGRLVQIYIDTDYNRERSRHDYLERVRLALEAALKQAADGGFAEGELHILELSGNVDSIAPAGKTLRQVLLEDVAAYLAQHQED